MQLLEPIQSILDSIQGKYAQYKQEVIKDFWVCLVSRECSLLGRKEVLTGKAKFGILGDGKEVPQVAMARSFKKGDFRSGYYRDQTFMLALGLCTVQDYFAQLYADPHNDPFSKGRQMNAHFGTKLITDEGNWINQTKEFNVSSDISSTAGQMARALGIAYASKYYRSLNSKKASENFSEKGNEVSFCTIGDASTSEGVFWETLNAAGVMQVPLAVSVWDDGYGISVPIELQTIKQSISSALSGFEADNKNNGIKIYKAKAWDYPGLVTMYNEGIDVVRTKHIPALFHIDEVTQPQGHSTSGSHERYKSKSRMEWELKFDCIKIMKEWLITSEIMSAEQIEILENESKNYVKNEKQIAWSNFLRAIITKKEELINLLQPGVHQEELNQLNNLKEPNLYELIEIARAIVFDTSTQFDKSPVKNWLGKQYEYADATYHTHLYSESDFAAIKVPEIPAIYSNDSKELNGYQILNTFFDHRFSTDERLLAFGEDLGKIGDVNQGFAGLQEKYGENRIFDTGIREWTIIGQAIGCALRGLRPISEIQYLDYVVYALSPLMDDLATLRYRSAGQQACPAIIRTRGHRLEGIWHTGSPMGMLLHSLRGIYLCVPRNMTQAAGMYNTLLKSDDPGLVIECLNAYRLKETLPDNIHEFTVPLGKVEILESGKDITLVSYGSCIRIAQKASEKLRNSGIHLELIDIQTLMPFDLDHTILESVKKTNKLIVLDEDVPGGASAFILQQIIEKQQAFKYLDSPPLTITAKDHRSPYGSTGDYFTKPNAEDIIELALNMMHEYNPSQYSKV